jgi:hypothetical protein
MRNAKRKLVPPLESEPAPEIRRCSRHDCAAEGDYPAPKSKDNLRDYWWFCLEHVREYNRCWNFCRGMDADQIEALIRTDTVWERPSWPMGGFVRTLSGIQPEEAATGFASFDAGERSNRGSHRTQEKADTNRPQDLAQNAEQKAALAVFDLSPPFTVMRIKARYKVLVKRHHPDANGGDKKSEDLLKVINAAYTVLIGCHEA